MRYLTFILIAICFIGCNEPCVRACYQENKEVVKIGFITKEELIINCNAYCNAPAIETSGYANEE